MSQINQVRSLLESLENGDSAPVAFINPEKYIQHNLNVADGLAGFGALLQNAPPGGFRVNVVRLFEDGDYVVAHTEYDFFGPKAAFDIFRFEDGLIVEHWDNLLPVAPPNPSGRTQFDGPTEVVDLEKTEANKTVVAEFVDRVLIGGDMSLLTSYVSSEKYRQHNPQIADGLDGLGAAVQALAEQGLAMRFDRRHMLLGQGNFVLSVTEGAFGDAPYAYYDLFRVEDGLIVEHWDVMAPIPPREDWKNDSGKF